MFNPHRKYISIFFLGLYMVFTMGFVVNSHYCEGKLVDLKIYKDSKSCCPTADGLEADCCENESETIFFEDEQTQIQKNTKSFISYVVIKPDADTSNLLDQGSEHSKLGYTDEIPPPNIPINILHCVFTFYG